MPGDGGFVGGAALTGAPGHLRLGFIEGLTVDDGYMVVPDVVHGCFSGVLLAGLGDAVDGDGFLSDGIAAVFLVFEDILDGSDGPCIIAGFGEDTLGFEAVSNFPEGHSRQEHIEDASHDLSFFRNDLRLTICALTESKQFAEVEYHITVFEPLAVAPRDVSAHAFTFCLGEACVDRHQQLAVTLEGVDVLFLKDDADAHQLELTDELDAFRSISGEPGDGLGDDVVNLAASAIPDHPLELVTLIRSGTRDALVGIDVHELPFGLAHDHLRVHPLLHGVAGELFFGVSGDSAVGSDPELIVFTAVRAFPGGRGYHRYRFLRDDGHFHLSHLVRWFFC